MAKAKGHLIGGLRGKLGDFVFRYRRGCTYVSKAPVFTQPPSELQVARRQLFAKAVAFAKAELAIPERRAYYQQLTRRRKGHTTAFNMAIKEFMRMQKVQQPLSTLQKSVSLPDPTLATKPQMHAATQPRGFKNLPAVSRQPHIIRKRVGIIHCHAKAARCQLPPLTDSS